MASISLNLDSRGKKQTSAVRLRISHNGTNSFLPTGVKVEPEYFDGTNMRQPISTKAMSAKEKNGQITNIIRKYDDTMLRISLDENIHLEELTANDIRAYIIGECAPVHVHVSVKAPKRGGREDFSTWFDTYSQTKKERVQSDMQYVGRLIAEYCKDSGRDRLWFDDLCYELLKDIEAWLDRTNRGDATRVKVMSYIRSAWNEAERMEMVEYGKSPFRFYKIRPVPVKEEIETISVDALRRLTRLELTEGTELARARDMMLLSFLLCGPDLIDLYHFEPQDGEEIVYIRHKNEEKGMRPVHVYIEPEIRIMLDMYHGERHLLNLQDRYPNYKTYQRNHNRACARLSDMVGEKVNMERIRRSWATIAGELEVPERVQNKSTGHVDSTIKNKHYEKYDWSRTRKYNRLVMDYVLYGE